MRLLRIRAGDESSGLEFEDAEGTLDGRSYAVLSHTWGKKRDEVTYQDMIDGTGKDKPGFRKIEFCRAQALKDGLQYFWIDTCCIDRSSSAELSEAINSMFDWYRRAKKCYVHLSDVCSADFAEEKPCTSAFQQSRWFTRSWTLQELIAPPTVEFFSEEGEKLGDKIMLKQEIHYRTGIPIPILCGQLLLRYSVDERLSWADRREAKRAEDEAYALLGLLNIQMPLIYGEGRRKAFARLKREIAQQAEPISSFSASSPRSGEYAPPTSPSQTPLEEDEKMFMTSSFENPKHLQRFNSWGGVQNNSVGQGNNFPGAHFAGTVYFR